MAHNGNTDALYDEIIAGRLTRRTLLKRAALLGLSAPIISGLLAACGGDDDDEDPTEPAAESTTEPAGSTESPASGASSPEADATEPAGSTEPPAASGEGVFGGRLRVAGTGQPAGLDNQYIAQRTVTMITWHMFEALFTFDGAYETVPMLAEGIEVSEDGLTATIALRQGVPFHNGDEMVAADVIASFNRWAPVSSLGLAIQPSLESITEVDQYTVEFKLTSPLAALPSMMARQSQGLSIHPASIMEANMDTPLGDDGYIGTGPYRFVERLADRYTLLARFDDYVGVDSPPSGYAGSKAAYFDEIEFIPVPDEAARVAGLQSGEYHYLEEIIPDQIEVVGDDPAVNIVILPPRSYGVIPMNTAEGMFTDVRLRKAVQAAIAVVPSGLATHGEGYFEPGPGIMMPQTAWDSAVGEEFYDMGDPELAAQLLEEAGYDGTPIRIVATQEDLGDYNAAVVAQQQLEEAGFRTDLQVMDEATLDELLEDDAAWDMTTGAYVFRPDPILIAAFASCTADGAWCTDEKLAIVERIKSETTFDARFAAFEELQALWYEQAPAIKLVNNFGVAALASNVVNAIESTHFEIEPEFVNSWFAEG